MARKLRILACAYACSPTAGAERFGGGESILGWNMVQQLARFHQVWVLTHAGNRPAIEASEQREPLSNVRFQYLDLPRWLGHLQQIQGGIQFYAYLWQIRAYFEARRLHGLFKFDAFHHITYANDWMASFIGALLPVPYIRGPGGGAHRTPKGLLNQYTFRGRLWERLRAAGQWLFRHDPFFAAGQSRAHAILVCNPEALEALPQKWRCKAHLFSVNGVSSADLALFVPRKPEDSTFRILSAGKFLRIKGFGLAIQSFAAFSQKYPGSEFTIVGDGPEFRHLDDLVRESGLQEQVRFEQWMPRADLLNKMASCDVFLFAGLRDGGGAVVVEAMSMGKPVVCLDIGGPAMHVTKDSGIKIAATSTEHCVKEMANALEQLYLDPKFRGELGKAARERAVQMYHWDRAGERMLEIYQRAFPTDRIA